MRALALALVLESAVLNQPVEQQTPGGATQPDQSLWVTNPTECVWDADDEVLYRASGELTGTVGASHCIVGDWKAHLVSVTMIATSPDLDVRVGLSGDGLSFEAVAVRTALPQKKWRYEACLYGPDYDQSHPLPMVAGSNGGVGEMWTGSVSITATRRVREVAASFRVGAEQSQRDCKAERLHIGPSVWRGWVG